MANGLSNLDANQVIRSVARDGENNSLSLSTLESSGLVPGEYDFIELTYVAAGNGVGEIETATYKQGGTGGSTLAILTLAYNGADQLVSVTRS